MFTPNRFAATHPELGRAKRLLVGYSGGLDSTVLLHLVHHAYPAATVVAVHVNHGLSPHAEAWQRHCASQCTRWGIPLIAESVTLNPAVGVEAAARAARYAVFERQLGPGDLLLQAHHADDQAETVLFRLVRGAGPRGLAGIPANRPLGMGHIVRPLLDQRRAELEHYARERGLSWVDDESNLEAHFDRNFLRLDVLPLLLERWPHAVAGLAASAGWCRDSDALLADLAREDLARAGECAERLGWSLDLDRLGGLEPRRRDNLVRGWARRRALPLPGREALSALTGDLLAARPDANPEVRWPGASLRRHGGRLYLLPDLPAALLEPLAWSDLSQPLTLPDGFELRATPDPLGPCLLPQGAALAVQWRRGGERCTPAGRQHSRPLKKLLQESNLEPWLRPHIPLVYCAEQLVAVGDLWVCEPFAAPADATQEGRWRFHWHRID